MLYRYQDYEQIVLAGEAGFEPSEMADSKSAALGHLATPHQIFGTRGQI